MTPPVTVAVVSWNTRALLDRCLTALEPEHAAGRAAVWVVDNASEDGSAQMAGERHPWATLLALEENAGFGAAVNRVAREAPRTEFLVCSNADTAPEPGALEALLSAAAADSGAGALAPRLVLPDGGTQHSAHPFPTLGFTLAFNLGVHRAVRRLGDAWCLEGHWDAERGRSVPWAVGAFLLLRRTAWDEAGGFDERQWMYAEDLDLGWRLARAGWTTRHVPDARVRHESGAATAQAWGDETVARWQRSTYAWMLRRRGGAVTRAVAAINVLGAGARWVPRVPLARIRPERWAHGRDTYREWARVHAAGLGPRARLEEHR